jgi:tetratricopeptide (TPR) repeat protein
MAAPSPEDLLRQARAADRAGQPEQAAAAYNALLTLRPKWADGWFNLAQAQWRSRQHEAALGSYQRAVDAGLRGPEEAHLNRSVILAQHLQRPDDARQELQTALRLNAQYAPAWLNLGNLHEQCGEREAARQAYEQVLTLAPGHALALSRLPDVQALKEPDDPIIERLQQALTSPHSTAADRADLGFGLGKALDTVGHFDDAFAAYAAANRASRDSAPPGLRYDAAAHTRFVDQLIASFQPSCPARTAEPDAPIFICGLFRSGSTLVEQMLAAHPQVVAGGELDWLPALAEARLRPQQDWGWLHDASQLAAERARYLSRAAALSCGAARLTDKRPDNFLNIGLIQALFPGARVVHTRRDVLDNALSLYCLHLGHAMPYALDLDDIAHWTVQYQRLMAHWHEVYPGCLHDLDYDRLVVDPEPVLRDLLEFCGLPWDPACLQFHRRAGVVQTASVWQVRQPLYTRSSGRWRHYAAHLSSLRAALSRTMDA